MYIVYNILKDKKIGVNFMENKNKKKVIKSLKELSNFLLVNERINSQRCVAQDIDTTKTIIENKDSNKK